jgi:hypothetical protein
MSDKPTQEAIGEITFQIPSKDSPGYLKRVKTALQLGTNLKAGDPQPETIDDIVAFLLPYITAPKDRKQAEELLWTASEEQFTRLMDLIAGKDGDDDEENPTE